MATKKIIGVPVLPGLPPGPGIVTVDNSDVSSDTADESSETVSMQSGPCQDDDKSTSVSSLAPRWTLAHIDFLPKSIKDDFEKFPKVVTLANQWLRENRYARLFSCETITFLTSGDRNLYTDSGVYIKSMHSDKKNRILKGLRIWYYTTDDTFYDEAQPSSATPSSIGYRNYMADHKTSNTASLVLRIGEDITSGDLGKVIRMEANTHLLDAGDADSCFWREEPQSNRQYTTFFRVFYLENQPESAKVTQFGVQDFLPKFDARSPHNHGYETYSQLWKRAARWLYTNTNIHVFNFQSFFLKYKKEDDPNSVTYIDRLTHTEHGSAYSSMSSKKTEYIQIIRAFYAKSTHQQFKSDVKQDMPARKCFYKSFAPSRMSKDETEELTDVSYQDLTQLEDKVNSWLNFSGARLVTLETVPVRLKTGGQESIGAEATFVYNEREKNMSREYWRNNIRLYIAGEYRQAPDQWRRVMTDR